ncbi:predicted protein [Lichtheimia corymbifera JMRC:FSU:9682]|uniref:Uncharacterized protein n=1 Tax=Lichtheimia corymbifera JMRC:FSU:9682 TaxID=1263082 RepID=A0A068S4C5_9FUNG|nr:predicted protein [Lichtheimia corymbifera JMRC:FSU:9682]
MKYASLPQPPAEEHPVIFPRLNDVVSVENCFYYLSLMERFLEYKRTLGPQLVKVMLARAEIRYARWLRYLSDASKSKSNNPKIAPPIDIGYMWHAHMLSPFRYFEDLARNVQLGVFKSSLPLKLMHRSGLMEGPSPHALYVWKQVYGNDEPYTLTAENVCIGNVAVQCCYCDKDMSCSWVEYTEWRFDPNVGIQCHGCKRETTVYNASLKKLAIDLERTSYRLAGTMLTRTGKLRLLEYPENEAMAKLVEIGNKNFYQQGLFVPGESLDDLINKIHRCSRDRSFEKEWLDHIPHIIGCIRGCYHGNPSPFSIDLIQAVSRQHEFNQKAIEVVNWQMPFGIARGIRQYHKFLGLMKRYPGQTLVPTLEIDLAWHTHMLHPQAYRAFTIKRVRQYINHDDNIDPVKLARFAEGTNMLWRNNYKGKNLINDNKNTNQPMDTGVQDKGFFSKMRSAMLGTNLGDFVDGNLPDGIILVTPGQKNIHLDTSFHDRRKVRALLQVFHRSGDAQAATYKAIEDTGYGYIGTINCASANVGIDPAAKTRSNLKKKRNSSEKKIDGEIFSGLGELIGDFAANGGCGGGGCATGGCGSAGAGCSGGAGGGCGGGGGGGGGCGGGGGGGGSS